MTILRIKLPARGHVPCKHDLARVLTCGVDNILSTSYVLITGVQISGVFVLIYDIYLSMPSINFFIFNRGLNFSSDLTKYEKLLDRDKLGVLLVPKITMVYLIVTVIQ